MLFVVVHSFSVLVDWYFFLSHLQVPSPLVEVEDLLLENVFGRSLLMVLQQLLVLQGTRVTENDHVVVQDQAVKKKKKLRNNSWLR